MSIHGAVPPKSMLILKSRSNSLTATEAFLRNRGWEVYSTADLKEALIQVVSKKHSYILISIDHPNKKIPMLPKLISEKYNVPVISFAESASTMSFNALTNSPADYKIYAPMTGPAVERCVHKHAKDLDTIGKLKLKNDDLQSDLLFLKRMKEEEEESANSIFVTGRTPIRNGFGNVFHRPPADILSGRLDELRKLSDANDSLIARGTHQSLIGNVEILDGVVIHKIEDTKMPACIFVDSLRFSGYLVAALGRNVPIDETLIQNIQKSLFSFLKENGEEISEHDALTVTLKPVEFEPWALEYADFLKTTVHKGNEMSMAFFPRKPLAPKYEASEHPDMMKLPLADLQGDRKVEFDLFMYLENNQKFILYTPKGGIFYTKQLNRLKGQGFTHLHTQKESVPEVSKYHAQNYLNELIDDYDEKQRQLDPAA